MALNRTKASFLSRRQTVLTYSIRRFFASDHRWRWRYTAIGGAILVLLLVQAVIDIADLAS